MNKDIVKKFKRKTPRSLRKELNELTERLATIKSEWMMAEQEAQIKRSKLESMDGSTKEYGVTKLKIDNLEKEISKLRTSYKETLELISAIESILKTRSERRATVGRTFGMLGLGAGSLLLGYHAEEVGKLTNRAATKFFDVAPRLFGPKN